MVMNIFRRIGKKENLSGVAALERILVENQGIGKHKEVKSLLQFIQNVASDDPVTSALALKLAIIEYINRHQLPEEERKKLTEALVKLPNRVNLNIEPIEIIDSAIYAVFLKRELQKTVESIPATEERKVEYLKELTEIVRDVLFTRALNEVKGPSDIRRISIYFGVPEQRIKEILYGKKSNQRYRKTNYTKKPMQKKKNLETKKTAKKGTDTEAPIEKASSVEKTASTASQEVVE